MSRCPYCGGSVPPSAGSKPRTFCSERCRVRQSEVRRSLRRQIEERVRERAIVAEWVAAGRSGFLYNVPVSPERIERLDRRLAELEAELALLGAG